jgi:hypothetical protein
VVDADSGMTLESDTTGLVNIELAAAGNAEVVKAKRRTLELLGHRQSIEDLMIVLETEIHVLHPVPGRDSLVVYVVVDRRAGNPGMTRVRAAEAARTLA